MPPENERENSAHDYVAQQAEHIPFKDGVLGSNPSVVTRKLYKIRFSHTENEIVQILASSAQNSTLKMEFFIFETTNLQPSSP